MAASRLPFSLVLFMLSTARADLPYNPTYILRPPQHDGNNIYILNPPSPSAIHGELFMFDAATILTSDDLSSTTLSDSLPFLESDRTAAYTSTLDTDGSIVVYSGKCSQGAAGSALWRFTPKINNGNGVWARQSYKTQEVGLSGAMSGANYLNAAIAFSANTTEADSDIYMFGGMCPLGNTTSQIWQDASNYSNDLLLFQASELSLVDAGPVQPIPEAGFSITPLDPAFLNASDGSAVVEQDFLLLGGHTRTAFINMSQVAVLSLPQSTWAFKGIDAPDVKRDVYARSDTTIVDPRSGHSATLISDKSKVVVIGGWVGDISTAAEPQLAILNVGIGYGGLGDWTWSIPSATKLPFGSSGLYGHGAVLLDGDVIMVTGGYNFPGSSGTVVKRASQIRNIRNYFFNVTSGNWISTYDPANISTLPTVTNKGTGKLKNSSQKVGLGVGLTVGLIALTLALILAWLCIRRRKRREEQRQHDVDKEIADLALQVNAQRGFYRDVGNDDEKTALDDVFSTECWNRQQRERDTWPSTSHRAESLGMNGWDDTGAYDAERTGLDLDIPSPRRGLRRSMYGRIGNSRLSGMTENSFRRSGYDTIYSIEERSEEGSLRGSSRKTSASQLQPRNALTVNTTFDSFPDHDPGEGPSSSRKPVRLGLIPKIVAPSPTAERISPAAERQREMSGWVRDWAAADALLHGGQETSPTKSGRSSPSKSDRTSSNLSDHSRRSMLDVPLPVEGVPSRTTSGRSVRYYFPNVQNGYTAISLSAESGSSNPSRPTTANPPTEPRHVASNSRTDAESFTTARSGISNLDPESEALLGSHLEPDTEPTFTRTSSSGSRSRSRMGGLVGSVRRAVFSGERSNSNSNVNRRSVSMTSPLPSAVIGGDGYYEYRDLGGRSSSSSPTRPGEESAGDATRNDAVGTDEATEVRNNAPVRRSVSDGASWWTSKRGPLHWNLDPLGAGPASISVASPFTLAGPLSSNPTRRSAGSRHAIAGLQLPVMEQQQQQQTSAGGGLSEDQMLPTTQYVVASSRTGSGQGGLRSATGQSFRSARGSVLSEVSGEWDVESAVEGRVVQVMFTVPRERLRVVNADMEVEVDVEEEVGAGVEEERDGELQRRVLVEGGGGGGGVE